MVYLLKMGIFHGYVSHNQMVSPINSPLYPPKHEEKPPFFGLSKHDSHQGTRGSLELIMTVFCWLNLTSHDEKFLMIRNS